MTTFEDIIQRGREREKLNLILVIPEKYHARLANGSTKWIPQMYIKMWSEYQSALTRSNRDE